MTFTVGPSLMRLTTFGPGHIESQGAIAHVHPMAALSSGSRTRDPAQPDASLREGVSLAPSRSSSASATSSVRVPMSSLVNTWCR
jgi:hypothetical protein